MGLDYPGGPLLAKLAEKGTPGRFKFPRPMTDRPGLDMSFSGLKTLLPIPLLQMATMNRPVRILLTPSKRPCVTL